MMKESHMRSPSADSVAVGMRRPRALRWIAAALAVGGTGMLGWAFWPIHWNNVLVIAASRGDAAGVRQAIRFGANPNYRETAGGRRPILPARLERSAMGSEGHGCDIYTERSVLHEAIQSRSVESVRLLLNAGARPNVVNGWNLSTLDHAIALNSLPIVSLLLEHGADPTAATWGDDTAGGGPALSTSDWNLLQWAGVDPHRMAPLIRALWAGRNPIVKRLLEAGALRVTDGQTARAALRIAVARGNEAGCSLLLRYGAGPADRKAQAALMATARANAEGRVP